jgi:endonuclease/exonuclease/phosphatase family metal-dependent hydrolase
MPVAERLLGLVQELVGRGGIAHRAMVAWPYRYGMEGAVGEECASILWAMRARVATFNIHHGLGTDGRLDLDRTSAVIRRIDPQLIALQELDRGLDRSGRVDQPAAIEEATGLTVRFRPTVTRPNGNEYGIAVASSDPLEDDFIALPRRDDEEPRGAIVALWHGVLVVATHLSTHRAARRDQIRALASRIESRDGPVLLLGDLNDRGWGLRPLRRAGLVFSRKSGRWLRWPGGAQPIDHIAGGGGIRIEAPRTISTPASDHAPLYADAEFPVH